MATAGPAPSHRHTDPLVYRLGEQEQTVLNVLLINRGRVISRRELARRAGLANLSERRCDSLLVAIRRALGPDSVVTVRSRGWMLTDDGITAAAFFFPPANAVCPLVSARALVHAKTRGPRLYIGDWTRVQYGLPRPRARPEH